MLRPSNKLPNPGAVRFPRVFYGWWIVVSVLLSLILHAGAYYSFGIFFKPMQVELGWSRADISWALFINQAIHGAGYVVVGSLVDRYDPRKVIPGFALCLLAGFILTSRAVALWQLYIAYGMIAGIGFGLGYSSLAGVIARWFEKKRGLALGIVSSGMAIGTILVPPVISYLIHKTDWRFTILTIGILLFAVYIVVAFVVKRRPEDKGMMPYGMTIEKLSTSEVIESAENPLTRDLTLRQAVKGKTLWVLVVSFALYTFGQQMVMFHLVNHATDAGLRQTTAAGILSLTGIGSLCGRLVMGSLADRFSPIKLLRVLMLAMAAALPALIFLHGVPGFMVFGLGFGLLYGGIVPLQATSLQSLFGSRSLGSVYGFVMFTLLVIGGLGTLSAGYVFDLTQSYSGAFVCSAVLCIVATVVTLLLKAARPKDRMGSPEIRIASDRNPKLKFPPNHDRKKDGG
jgi:MFS family permease